MVTIKSEHVADGIHELMAQMVRIRQNLGMTQRDVREKSGIMQSDISKYEHGQKEPSLTTMARLAEAMGLQIQIRIVPMGKTEE